LAEIARQRAVIDTASGIVAGVEGPETGGRPVVREKPPTRR